MLELSDRDIKVTIINILKDYLKMWMTFCRWESSAEIKTIKKSLMKILKIKNMISGPAGVAQTVESHPMHHLLC